MWSISARTLVGLAAASAALLTAAAPAGAHHPVEGILQGVHADYFGEATSDTDWLLDTGARTIPVLPTTLPALSPDDARVSIDDKDPGAGVAGPVTAASPQAAPLLGGRKTAVIAFNFASNPAQPWSPAHIQNRIFTDSNSASAFFREESYGKLWLTGKSGNTNGDVYGWYTIPAPPVGCKPPDEGGVDAWAQWATAAELQAAENGFKRSDYQHVMYVFPSGSDCEWAGLAYIGGKQSWINGDLSVRVTGHELGHNLGLHHAGSLACTNASGQPVPLSSTCSWFEYRDPFDVMGNMGTRHNHGRHLQQLGLLGPSNVQTVGASGTYSMRSALYPTTEPTTLRVPRSYTSGGAVAEWYYLEVRERGGVFESDFAASDPFATGVSVRIAADSSQASQSRLLDTRPAGGGIYDAPLLPGKTFSDGQMSVTTVSAGAGAATVSIDMAAPPLDQQSPTAPTGLSHTMLGTTLRLAWSGSADNVGVTSYPVFRDGVEIGTASGNTFDDAGVAPGPHVYTVYAQDEAANRSSPSAPYVVTVPAATTTKLKTGKSDRRRPSVRLRRKRLRDGSMLLTARATDSSGIARVELRVDGRKVRARRAARVSFRWRGRPGRHRLVAVAFDKRGNRGVVELRLRVRAA